MIYNQNLLWRVQVWWIGVRVEQQIPKRSSVSISIYLAGFPYPCQTLAARPPLIQLLVPIENQETSFSGPAKTTGNDTIAPQSPHPSPVNLPTNASPPQTMSTSFESPGHDSPSKSSIPSSLPWLRGFFNKLKTKSQPEKSAGRWLSHPQVFFFFFWCFYIFITFITSFILSAIQVSSSAIVLCHQW